MTSLTLSARPPFSLTVVVNSHGWIRLAPFREEKESGGFTYIARLVSGQVTELHILEASVGVKVNTNANLDSSERADVIAKVDWMLGLDQDFSEFYSLARQEPKLSQAEVRMQGRVLRSPTLFEDTVKTILTTNTAWGGTIRMVQALVDLFGDPLPGDPQKHAFPTPERLAAENLESMGAARLGYRTPYVLALAGAVASGALDLEAYRHSDLPTLELRKELLKIKGIGTYAAANLLVLLGRYDFLPVDSWALKMVSHEWHRGEPISPAEVEAAFAAWGAWKGLAYWFWDWAYTG
jgi:3-methyladenine DNA glycosylase/8-oxoguanine DNA glycosylase